MSEGQSPGQKSNTARLRKIDREEDGNNTDLDYTDTEGENSDNDYNRERTFTGRIDIVGPSHADPTVIVLHRKLCAVVMFKQDKTFAPALAEADSGSASRRRTTSTSKGTGPSAAGSRSWTYRAPR